MHEMGPGSVFPERRARVPTLRLVLDVRRTSPQPKGQISCTGGDTSSSKGVQQPNLNFIVPLKKLLSVIRF